MPRRGSDAANAPSFVVGSAHPADLDAATHTMRPLLVLPLLLFFLGACKTGPEYGRALPAGARALLPLDPKDPRPDVRADWAQRDEILPAVERSIAWTKKKSSPQFFPIEGMSLERQVRTLESFRDALTQSQSADEFAQRIDRDFVWMKSAGWNGTGGGVLFTAYCTPILDGRKERDDTYRYPLYALPSDLKKGEHGAILGRATVDGVEPYPARHVIDNTGMLEGANLELAWLRDPLDAYIAHVNGSAFIKLEDGELYRLGYAGKNGRRYTSLGQELVKDEHLDADEVSLRTIREWAARHPEELARYMQKNDSYVFFTPITDDPHGSLDFPVTANRSLATDKELFPRASVVWIERKKDSKDAKGAPLERFVLDQDTGGAIRTAGRADFYVGIGPEAERVAGETKAEGQMYYLFAKE